MNEKKLYKIVVIILLSIFLYGCQSSKKFNPKDKIKDDKLISKENDNKPKTNDYDNKEPIKEPSKESTKEPSKEHQKEPNKDNEIKVDKPWSEDNDSSKVADTAVDNKKTSWWFTRNKTHTTPNINGGIKYKLSDYGAHYVGDTTRKVLYLTFDEGYENGYTGRILDTLKNNDVKVTFFVTLPYLNSDPALVKRMVDEGHAVANHTKKHLSMPDITSNKESFDKELTSVEDKFKEITGKKLSPYFRPPMGHYSEKSLAMTKNLGYKSIFWSFAYNDWEPKEQPEPKYAKDMILGGIHNGAIILLHAVSKTNTEILDDLIKQAKIQGYNFELLP